MALVPLAINFRAGVYNRLAMTRRLSGSSYVNRLDTKSSRPKTGTETETIAEAVGQVWETL
jgi:hypothetical protein